MIVLTVLYDLAYCHFSFVGRLFVKANGKPGEIIGKLKEMAGYAPEEEIELYEVRSVQQKFSFFLFDVCCNMQFFNVCSCFLGKSC